MDGRRDTREQRVSSPILFPGLWTGGVGDPAAESEQSSLVLWSMDWRRETQEQRLSSPLLFPGLLTGGEGDQGAESEQSSLFL